MYEDVIQRQTNERPAWLNVIMPFVRVMLGKKTARMGEQRYDERSNHMTIIYRLQQSNMSSLIMLVFLSIAACWTAHPREFLFLIICNRFVPNPRGRSAKHTVQPSPALSNRIPSTLWAEGLPAPRGIGYEGRDLRLIF